VTVFKLVPRAKAKSDISDFDEFERNPGSGGRVSGSEGVKVATDIDKCALKEVIDGRERSIRVDPARGQTSGGGIIGPHSRLRGPLGTTGIGVGVSSIRGDGTGGGFTGVPEIQVVEGSLGQDRVRVVATLDGTKQAGVCDLRVLRGKVKLSTGTARIRLKLHHERIVSIGISVILS